MLSVLIAGSTVAGCSDPSPEPATSPTAAAPGAPNTEQPGASAVLDNGPSGAPDSGPPGAAAAQVDEPPGVIACGKAVRAVRDATLMNPGVIADITAATGTADAPVADAAQNLSAAYRTAVAAHDTDAEPDAVAAVSAAAAELVKICDDSGLGTAG